MPTVIHIVDDDASFRTAIGGLLQVSGYEIAVYESAKQLLERLPDDVGPSCILLDVQMPDLGGRELQGRLAELGSTLPIVFLTGHGDIPTTVEAIKAGAEDFLTKPVRKDKLLNAIERAISRHQKTREQLDRLTELKALVGTLTPRESRGLQAGCSRKGEQTDCFGTGDFGADSQGTSAKSDGEGPSSVACRARIDC